MDLGRRHGWLSVLLTVVVLVSTLSPSPRGAIAAGAQSAGDLAIQPRGDAGLTGTMPSTGPAEEPVFLWEAPSNGTVISGMAIREDTLAFSTREGSGGFLRAVERASGDEVWNVEFGDEASVFGPAVAADLFVVGVWSGDEGSAVVALDALSGEEAWRAELDAYAHAPTYADGVVYVPLEGGMSADSALVALDAGSGEELWRYDAPEALNLGSRVAVADGMVVATAWSLDENGIGAYGFDAESGELLWTFTETDELNFDPLVADGVVLITNLPAIWALDLETGEVLWTASVGSVGGGPALANGMAYYGLRDEVRALDMETGEEVWTSPVGSIAGPPIVADGVVYTAMWRPSDDHDLHALYALDAETGDQLWELELDYQVSGNEPLAADGVMYVDANGAVVAFGSEGAAPADGGTEEGGTYESEEFGYTITWNAPWSLRESESSTDDGRDFTTLEIGAATLSIRTSELALDAEEMMETIISGRESGYDDFELLASKGDADFAAATMAFSEGGLATIEYFELTTVGDGVLRLVILKAPESRFSFLFALAQGAITIDDEPVYTSAPAAPGPSFDRRSASDHTLHIAIVELQTCLAVILERT